MNPTIISVVALACTLAGTVVGMGLRHLLPAHHLGEESRDTMKLGIGLIATMTALVLGLVTASAKSSFDAVDAQVRHSAMELVLLACALSVSSAIFLVLEMDGPFDGVLKVSPGPLRYAYERLGH